MKKSTWMSLIVLIVLIPATLFLGTRLSGKWYYLTSTLVIIEAMLPFFFAFEGRKPQARELVTIAVMAALAVAGRVAIPIPNFKAVTGIIMITGIALGPQAGFMTGAIAAFASNFFYSQGPWTPWQMLAYGLAGFIAGLIFYNKQKKLREKKLWYLITLVVFGFVATAFCVGPILDTSSIFTTASKVTWSYVGAVYAAGLMHNIIHGLGTAATLLLLGIPLLGKLERLKTKYGMMEAGNGV